MIDPLTLASMIPTVMNLGSQIASLVPKREKRNFVPGGTYQYKKGGSTRGYKQYNAPTHEQGGQTINQNGTPVPNTGHEVEKKEAAYKYSKLKNDTYIFPNSKPLKKLLAKYKNANTNPQAKMALELEINRLEKSNEQSKQPPKQYKDGGNVKYSLGGNRNPLNPLTGLTNVLSMYKNLKTNPQSFDVFNKSTNPNIKGYPTAMDKPLLSVDKLASRSNDRVIAPLSTPITTNEDRLHSKLNTNIEDDKYSTFGVQKPITANNIKDNKSSSFDVNKVARLAGQIGNSLQLLNKKEVEKPIYTNYNNTRANLNNLSNSTDALKQSANQQANLTSNLNRSSASSFNQYSNRQNQNFANLSQTLQNINLQGLNLSNQNALTKAQVESSIAQDNKQTLQQNLINNQENAANNRTIKKGVSSDILYELDRQSTIKNNKGFADATNQQGIAMLQSMFPDIGVNGLMVSALQKTARGEKLSAKEQEAYTNFNTLTFKS